MTQEHASSAPFTPHRRSPLAIARDLLVAALCALLVLGFLFDVGGGARDQRPASHRAATLSS